LRSLQELRKFRPPQPLVELNFFLRPVGRETGYSSVTQPSEALLTFLMYLYSVPRVTL
jgi:hypothetical protein